MFALTSILTLALAIGANASIFAVVQRVVLNPLPYPDSDRVIRLDHAVPRMNIPSFESMPIGMYFQYADRAQTLAAVGTYRSDELTLTGVGDPVRIRVAWVTPSMSEILRVSPEMGRWFTEREGTPGAPQVAVVSHGLWVRQYGGDPTVVGQSVRLSGVPTEIIGVMPASYAFPDPQTDAWLPDQITRAGGFGIYTHTGVARLRDGATLEDARAELNGLIRDLPQTYPNSPMALSIATEDRMRSVAITVKEATVGSIERALWMLLASVSLVLLIAYANVANLCLVRSDARQREVAVRRALGAGRAGIARYFLAESALLSIAGGALGLALAWGAARFLVASGPTNLPRLHEIRLDGVAVAFTFTLSALAALAFGALPLARFAPLAASLHDSGRGYTATPVRHRARRLLMAGQIALALVLLVASGLMVRSFQKLRTIDPGFDPSSALTFRVGLPDRDYANRQAVVAAHQSIIDRLSTLPDVTAASASTALPLDGFAYGNTLLVEGRPYRQNAPLTVVAFRAVAGGYLEAMGIRLMRGHSILRADVDRSERIVVINQALADVIFPDQNPIGQHVASSKAPSRPGEAPSVTWLTIVGIASNTTTAALAERRPIPTLYMPMSIAGGPGIPIVALVGPNVGTMSYIVRSKSSPLALLPVVRRAIDGVDRSLAIADARTLQDALDRASAQMAFTMVLLAIAAAVALMLGVVGIYGAMSYIVSQRTGEVGVRLALGAEPTTITRMITRQGGLVALAGIVTGLAAAFAGSRLIASLLYGISPRDPVVFGAATVTLLGVALAACWLPARRAANLNPLDALRAD